MVWSFTLFLSSPFLQQSCTAFDLLSKHQRLVAGGAFTASLNRLETHSESGSANKTRIDVSFILNDHFFRKTLGIQNLQTCKILQIVQLIWKERAHWLLLRYLHPSELFAWDSSWGSVVPVTYTNNTLEMCMKHSIKSMWGNYKKRGVKVRLNK